MSHIILLHCQTDPLVLVNNVWDDTAKNPVAWSLGEHWDPQTVFSNLLLTPRQLWDATPQTSADAMETFESRASYWHVSVGDPFRSCLEALSDKVSSLGPADATQEHQLESVTLADREKCERRARYEWKKLELEFYQDLKRKIGEVKEPFVAKTKLVDYLDLPCQASRGPTRKHSEDAETAVLGLMDAIAEEKKEKETMERRQSTANLRSYSLTAPFAALLSHAVYHLSPLDVAFSHQCNQAVVNHLLQGLQTKVELDGSMTIAINQCQCTEEIAEGSGRNALMSKFYNSMLCSSSGRATELQEGLLELLPSGNAVDMDAELLQLAVLAGRVDLAALSLQEIADLYEVSVVAVVEDGHPVVVVQIKLPRNTNVNVFYRRRDLTSVFWSMPSRIFVERNGQPVYDLFGPANQRMCARMHLSAGGILSHICRQVQGLDHE